MTTIHSKIPPDDWEFLLQMDRFYLGMNASDKGITSDDSAMIPGGLSNIINVIGHVEEEIRYGTLARIKLRWNSELPKNACPKSQDEHSVIVEFFKAHRRPESGHLDEILDEAQILAEQKRAFWNEFTNRVRKLLGFEPRFSIGESGLLEDASKIRTYLQAKIDEIPPPDSPNMRDRRDKYIYYLSWTSCPHRKIKDLANDKYRDLDPLKTINAVKAAASRFAKRQCPPLDLPPGRLPGRPKSKPA